jgi:HTH-type transcriptional regulator/antitoxin HigA
MTRSTPRQLNSPIKPLRTAKDHADALREIERLWRSPARSPEGDRLEVLVTLVESYEENHFPMDLPDPIDAILFRMEQQELTPADLSGVIGSRTRVYEVLRRDRPLSLEMIRRLNKQLGIPAEVLLQPARPRRKLKAA